MSIIINPKKVSKEELTGFRPLSHEEKRIYKQKTTETYPTLLVLSFLFAFGIFGMILIPAFGFSDGQDISMHHAEIPLSLFLLCAVTVSFLSGLVLYLTTMKINKKMSDEDLKSIEIDVLECQVYEAFRCTDAAQKVYQVYIIAGDTACKTSFRAIDFDFRQWLSSPNMHVLLFREKKKSTYKYSVHNVDILNIKG